MYAQHFCVNTWLSVSLPATVQDTGQGLTMTPPPSAVPSAVVICLMSRWKTKPRMNCWDPVASEGGAGTGTQVCLTPGPVFLPGFKWSELPESRTDL